MQGLTNIFIPDSVTLIGDNAFKDNQLISVIIPDSVTIIGDGAFDGNQLTSVVIPDGVTTIGIDAFSSNRLTNIEIPDGVTTIGGYAFYGNQVNSVVIPENTEVDPDAFGSHVEIIRRPMGSPIDIQLSSQSFSEGLPSGSVVAALTSRDPDADDAHTYVLVSGNGDTDNNAFTIDGDQLIILESPDYVAQDSYSIRLRTTDAGGLSFDKTIQLTVYKNVLVHDSSIYKLLKNDQVINLTMLGRKTLSDASSTFWDVVQAVAVDIGFMVLWKDRVSLKISFEFGVQTI